MDINNTVITEGVNYDISREFASQDVSLNAVKVASEAVERKEDLTSFSRLCHAAIIRQVEDADPLFKFADDPTEYVFNIRQFGGYIKTAPASKSVRSFQKKVAVSIVLGLLPLNPKVTDPKKKFVDLWDVLEGRVAVKVAVDADLLSNIESIIFYYREAFNKVYFPNAGAARAARTQARRDAAIDNAFSTSNINEDDTCYAIGWLAKHITSIKAEIPNTAKDIRDLERDFPILKDIPEEARTSYYGVHKGDARNRWDKSTKISVSTLTPMPKSVSEYLRVISGNRSTVERDGISSNVAALELRKYGFTLGPNNPERVKAFCQNYFAGSPESLNNFLAGFDGLRRAPAFNPEVEAEVNPLNQEFPPAEF